MKNRYLALHFIIHSFLVFLRQICNYIFAQGKTKYIGRLILLFFLGFYTYGCSETKSTTIPENGYMNSGYTKEELTAMGVDTAHLFVFSDKQATYNGREFSIHLPLTSFQDVFGPYDRVVNGEGGNKGYDHYFWDEIGFCALVSPENQVINFDLHWDYITNKKPHERDDSDEIPEKFFKSKILLNGYPLDNMSDLQSYCNDPQVKKQLLEWARAMWSRNYEQFLYYYHPLQGFYRYNLVFHDLYLYDYSKFIGVEGEERPFFSYVMKVDSETDRLHSFGMQYGVFSNPNVPKIHLH